MPYKNPEHQKLYQKLQYEKYLERTDKTRKWSKQDPFRRKLSAAAKRANARYPGVITAEELAEIASDCNYFCYWCKKEERKPLSGGNLTFEHLQPLNSKETITIACLVHNSEKRHRNGGAKKTDEEKLEHQRELERRRQIRNADALKKKAHKRYLKNKEITQLRAALRYAQGLTKEAMKEYTKTHRVEARERSRLWRLAHPERSKAAKRKCYLKRKKELAQKMREYYEQNKEAIKARAREYYHKKKAARSAGANGAGAP
jgi:hypothetical protein